MEQLQHHITSEEQSDKLIKLGIHSRLADFYTDENECINCINDSNLFRGDFFDFYKGYKPGWSTGRLIEILEIATETVWVDYPLLGRKDTLIERVIDDIEKAFKFNMFDLAKLDRYYVEQ